MKVIYKGVLLFVLAVLSACNPTVRKTVRPSDAVYNSDSKKHDSHVVPDVVAATESVEPSSASNFQWQTKEQNPDAVFVNIPFEYNSYTVSEAGAALLIKISAHLQKKKELKLIIEGHCDERGSDEYNLALGEKRAHAVSAYLMGLGIDSKRLSTISYGEERPKNSAQNESAWAENRRVQFEVVK